MDIKKLLVAGSTAAIMFGPMASQAFAGYGIKIIGNGEKGTHNIVLSIIRTTNTTQSNSSNISNDVEQRGETGENRVTGNVGPVDGSDSSITVETGTVDQELNVDNTGGTNLVADPCDCAQGDDVMVDVEGNGEESTTTAAVTSNDTSNENQANSTSTENKAEQKGESGENTVHSNTGIGTYRITTNQVLNRLNLRNYGDVNGVNVTPTN